MTLTTHNGRKSRRRNGKAPLFVMLVVGALVLGGYLHLLISASRPHASSGSFATLVDHRGRVFATGPQAHDYKLVAFGYTHCPDVCPVTMLKVREILHALGTNDQRVVPLFVTVDPVHDTVAVLAQYTAAFDPRIVGITGASQQLRAFAAAYGVLPDAPAQAGNEDMPGHSAMIYLLGPDNAMLGMYGPAEAAKSIAMDILRRTDPIADASVVHGERS